ncbi:MAG: epoxyqueuosine reductase QueH [Clostridia bacterium]|nr:epoxyqueuosine reductase QueH [Clostridia bacterium]
MSKLLLHCCCGPCAMYPVYDLIQNFYSENDMSLFWYNPNIHPEFEWNRRQENLKKVAEHYGLELLILEGFMQSYWESKEYLKPSGNYDSRCDLCYDIRIDNTCRYAAEHGFDIVSTTLLVSPYQQHDKIKDLFEIKAQEYGLKFDYHDWREHFREGQKMARDIDLYRQKYCGCIFSLDESEFKEKIIKSFS